MRNVQSMTLQSQQRIINQLDIELKTIQLAKLKREEKNKWSTTWP